MLSCVFCSLLQRNTEKKARFIQTYVSHDINCSHKHWLQFILTYELVVAFTFVVIWKKFWNDNWLQYLQNRLLQHFFQSRMLSRAVRKTPKDRMQPACRVLSRPDIRHTTFHHDYFLKSISVSFLVHIFPLHIKILNFF